MGLLKKYFNQTRKPEGFLGKLMLGGMNSGHSKMADFGMSYLPNDDFLQIVDLGCGGGRNINALLKKYPNAFVKGIDYSSLSVEKAQKYNKKASSRVEIRQVDVAKLKLDNNYFDLVTAFETIYFWPGLEACFKNIFNVLKDDGYFLIVNESDGLDKTSKKFESIIEGMKIYTVEEITEYLTKAGFKDIKSYYHAKKPWIALLAKK